MKTARCNFGVGKLSAQSRRLPQGFPLRLCSKAAKRLPPLAACAGSRSGRNSDRRASRDSHRDWEAHRLSAEPDSCEPSTSGRLDGTYGYSYEDDGSDDTLTPLSSPSTTSQDIFMGGIPISNLFRPDEFKPFLNPHFFPDNTLPHRLEDLKEVYVILFGVDTQETEGIYSLRAFSREDNLPQDTIIAFVDIVDAERYTGLLEATMHHKPHVVPIEPPELVGFCEDAGYSFRLEPRGSLLIPPDYNVGMTDWERCVQLKRGNFTVLDSDPVLEQTPWPCPEYRLPGILPALENNAGMYDVREESIEAYRRRLECQWK